MAFSIGIDLGTTNTVVATARRGVNGTVEVITEKIMQLSEDGFMPESNEILPSILYVEDGEHYVGQYAKAMKEQKPGRVIFSSKNFMGQSNYNWMIDGKSFSPEITASYFLGAVKKHLEERYTYECDLSSVVITVPASFDLDQKNATKKAAKLAGFEGEIICISEPTAAMLDFINEQRRLSDEDHYLDLSTNKRILVFDLGGGTCDVAILEVKIKGREVYVEEVGVSPHTLLGGTNFDVYATQGIMNAYEAAEGLKLKEVLSEEAFRELTMKLLVHMEKAKIFFSARYAHKADDSITYPVLIPNIINGQPFKMIISMKDYNGYIAPLLNKEHKQENIISPIESTLKATGLEANEIDYVFTVGGMAQYPEVNRVITEYFGREPYKFCENLQSIAKGAAIYQHYDIKEKQEEDIDIDIIPTLPQTVFLNVLNAFPIPLIEAKTKAGTPIIHKNLLQVTSEVQSVLQLYTGRSFFDPEMKFLNDVVLEFSHGVPLGNHISLRLEYTQKGSLEFEAWIEELPHIKINVCLEGETLTGAEIKKVQENYQIEKVGGLYNGNARL